MSLFAFTRQATSSLRYAPRAIGCASLQYAQRKCMSSAAETVSNTDTDREYIRNMSMKEWKHRWTDAVQHIDHKLTYTESSDQLRKLIKGGLLRFTDLRDNPERFFEAHRILALHAPKLGPGFWIRFTVQYNLFAGTILGLATDKQRAALDVMQSEGTLGCFGLTEKLAGVNSGLVINTTATYDHGTQTFTLNTPGEGSEKNWISQGYVADKALIFADLHIDGKSKGGHGFVLDMRTDGKLAEGVEIFDMGRKTVGNDLDNASIRLTNVTIPKDTLLSRFGGINSDGVYEPAPKGIVPMQMIGQRLFTGRVAVAQAALSFSRELFRMTKEYSDNKKCWAPEGSPMLTDIPQLKALYAEAAERDTNLTKFVAKCEAELSEALKKHELPSLKLIESIACAKVLGVEQSIELTHRLKQEVGSYALMAETGFEQLDFLQCCKFAEGDSRILMQKMARDRMRIFTKKQQQVDNSDPELKLCGEIAAGMATALKQNGGDKQAAWDDQWVNTYDLARATMKRTMADFMAN
ncbi:hypothetical protein SARC_08691 [Sphaeroforma arctica JP610]|uniref:Acyl-CoA oxidase/dehydrogenase middle domain-containing protein n=1 Tax=Sphaeroforma arctica JP610 TaxID=667725 RepID=A0A0L0FQ18_9EUKA|nr:hypothetical protein SARC_08691 [Sphaeroforma arctica JP610]KNC78897.1 hypothetical protein SARC_08691 [Sphaeroforma arctica JP610]|eukprot:XP_014152799.1 hypothetical protein SARC_08691 [Sphaeroforma arctica JP610]